MDRRDFLKAGALASAGGVLGLDGVSGQTIKPARIAVRLQAADSLKTRLAVRELLTGLHLLFPTVQAKQADGAIASGTIVLVLTIDRSGFKGDEEYEVATAPAGAMLRAASEQALLFAVFDFLEKQGMVFGIDGGMAPIDRQAELHLPARGLPWAASPVFAVRGLLPWPDFLNCISVYNYEDFKEYFAAMLRMRFNMFGMDAYTENEPVPMAGI